MRFSFGHLSGCENRKHILDKHQKPSLTNVAAFSPNKISYKIKNMIPSLPPRVKLR